MTTPELLPCPFCGGEASDAGYVFYRKPCEDTVWEDGSPITEAFFCNCPKCGINNMSGHIGYRTKAQAIAAWNTRAPLSPAVLAALPEVQALIRAETERCAELVEAILKQDAKAAEPHNTAIASERWEYAEQLPAAIREGRA